MKGTCKTCGGSLPIGQRVYCGSACYAISQNRSRRTSRVHLMERIRKLEEQVKYQDEFIEDLKLQNRILREHKGLMAEIKISREQAKT